LGAGSFSMGTTSDAALWAKALVASSAPAAMPASVLARMVTFFSSDSVSGTPNQSNQTQCGRSIGRRCRPIPSCNEFHALSAVLQAPGPEQRGRCLRPPPLRRRDLRAIGIVLVRFGSDQLPRALLLPQCPA